MIEISKRNGNWEAYVDGGFFGYNSDLEDLLSDLAAQSDEIESEPEEEEE